VNRDAKLLLAEARRRSPTIARLLAALEARDLVVYLEVRLGGVELHQTASVQIERHRRSSITGLQPAPRPTECWGGGRG
jgi:hypothetical protein